MLKSPLWGYFTNEIHHPLTIELKLHQLYEECNMRISVSEKLKLMRQSERLESLPETATMFGLNRDALWRYENGKTIPNTDVITQILSHPRFEKYALWFVTGKTAPEVGQIAPALYNPANYEQNDEQSA